jgi:hypothetical protein
VKRGEFAQETLNIVKNINQSPVIEYARRNLKIHGSINDLALQRREIVETRHRAFLVFRHEVP